MPLAINAFRLVTGYVDHVQSPGGGVVAYLGDLASWHHVLKDGLFPVSLHEIPVLNLAMTDGIVYTVAWSLRVCERLVADKEIKVLDSSLGCEIAGFRWHSRACAGALCSGATSGNGCRKNATRSRVTTQLIAELLDVHSQRGV